MSFCCCCYFSHQPRIKLSIHFWPLIYSHQQHLHLLLLLINYLSTRLNSLQFIIPAWINYYEHDLTTATELFNNPRSGGRRGSSETELTLFHSWPSKFVGNLSGHTQATTPQQQRPRMKTIIAILIPIAISIPIQCRRTAGRRRTVVDQEKSIEERRHIIFGISLSISTIKRNINDEIDGR